MKEIYINGQISRGWNSLDMIQELLYDLPEGEQLTVYLNSPGGDLIEGLAIYNYFLQMKPRPVIKIIGMAASIASVIACAGEKVMIAESAMMMIHNPSVTEMTHAESSDLKKLAETLDKLKVPMIQAYVKKTGKTPEEISALMDGETFFTAAEAVKLKLADSVYAPDAIENKSLYKIAALMTPKDLTQFQNTTKKQNLEQTNNGGIMPTPEEMQARMQALENENKSYQARLDAFNSTTAEQAKTLAELKEQATNFKAMSDKLNAENAELKDKLVQSDVSAAVERLVAEGKVKRDEATYLTAKLTGIKIQNVMIGEQSLYDMEMTALANRQPVIAQGNMKFDKVPEPASELDDLNAQSDYVANWNKRRVS